MEPTSETPPIEVTFANVLGEHLSADRLLYKSTIFWKLDKVVGVVLVALGLFALLKVGPVWWAFLVATLGVLEILGIASLRPLQVVIWFKSNPKLRETYRLRLDDEGIHFRTASIDSRVKWNHYTRLLENEKLFLLVYGARMYTLLPKRAFASAAERDSFRKLVLRNLAAVGHGA